MLERMKGRLVALLRWSERYTKTDMLYLTRGGFWSVIGQIIASVITLGLAVVIARFVPKNAYGSYKYILSFIAILSTFSLSGIGNAVFQSTVHGYRSALKDGFLANLRWSLIIFIGALIGGLYYLLHGNTTIGISILFGGCLTPFFAGYNLYAPFFAAEKDFRAVAWYGDMLTNFIPALAIGIVAYLAPQPPYLVAAYFITNTIVAMYAYERAQKLYPTLDNRHDTGLISYSKHLSLMNILTGIAGNIDQILLFHYVGPVELAIYNFAIAIPDQLKGPLKTLDSMLQAQFARRSEKEIRSTMRHKISLLSLFYLLVTILYIILAPLIYHIFFSTYLDAVFYSQLYAISILIFGLGPAASFFAVKRRIKEQYIINVVSSVFQIIAMIMGTVWWGLLGLIIARIVARYVTTGLSYLLFILSS